MKFLKGFGKKYFSLVAITMHTTAKNLRDNEVFSKKISLNLSDYSQEEEESPPLEELLLINTFCVNSVKPCHCDCIFKIKTKLAILNFKFIPRCPYYTVCFAFRRTGVHPPLLLSFQ
ncbi:MAG: hypothetical protein C0625_16810 [Arcobacter sp.]|nr:MAG: hypothetical protein C0625_16810 [Arcobacter sp.]